jgi:hypothetical protein
MTPAQREVVHQSIRVLNSEINTNKLIEEQTFIKVTVGKANVSIPASTSVTYLIQLLLEPMI